MLTRLSLAGVFLLVSLPALASAEEAVSERPEAAWMARRELVVTARHGVFIDGQSAGIVIGADVLHRRGPLVLGAVGDYGATVFTAYTYWAGAAALGISAPTPSWLRVDLLGVAGVHAYSHVGVLPAPAAAAVLGVPYDDGSSAVLPFAGARLRSSLELGASKRFAIGLEGLAETDVTRAHTERHTVGTQRLSGALTLGGAFDL